MDTLEDIIGGGKNTCHHLAIGQYRRCGVCGQDAEVAAIDMPPGYAGLYRPLCCRPICAPCCKTHKPLVRAEPIRVHSEISDLEALLKKEKSRRKIKLPI